MFSNLRVSVKLAVFGVAAVALSVVLAAARVASDRAAVEAARQELRGAEYLEALSQLFQRVAEHRGLASQLLSGADVRTQVVQKQRDVRSALDAVAEVDRRHGRWLDTSASLERVQGRWDRIVARLDSLKPHESFQEHSQLVADVLDLIWHVGVTSGITLDPYADGLYLGNVVLGALPRAIEAMGQLRALGSGVLTRRAATVPERAAVQERIGAARLLHEEVARQLAEAFGASPAARTALEAKLKEGDGLVEEYLRTAEEQVARAERLRASPQQYFALATRAIDSRFDLYREATRVLRDVLSRRTARVQKGMWGVAGASLILVALVAALGVATTRSVTGPLGRLVQALERVGQGDLRVELGLRGRDEVVQVAQAFDRLVAWLRQTVGRVSEVSQTLTASAEEMAATSEQTNRSVGEIAAAVQGVSQGAETQARKVTEVAEVVRRVAAGLQEAAQDALGTASAASAADQTATRGRTYVEQAQAAMGSIREATQAASEVIASLGRRSRDIGRIVQLITDIASQTNLLALNAAIEAARAGDQGRGFAVVAEEVRKLAQESAQAAEQIAELVQEIQREAERSVQAMERAGGEVERGVQVMGSAGEAFADILRSVQAVAERVERIRSSSEGLASSAQRVEGSVGELASVSEQNSASAEQVSAATQQISAGSHELATHAQSLARLATELQGLVAQFQV
ncbi:MAG: methyl-accepting chemotaxis protein [Armatimonadota bacterium]|nr:methyl-accepting chemotaxis protein [Armatimonadota bacterium]